MEIKKVIAAALVAIAVIFGLTACEGDTGSSTTTDTYPHGFIYVPPMGKSPGVGPIFY
ncbi:membrane protein [Mycobacterium phage QueenB2]|nr:membrane protein [Mycobacterium phage QueenB2]